MSYIKASAGNACKVAEVLNANWVQAPHSLVKEAVALDSTVVAYQDADGCFVAAAYVDVDTSGVMA